MACLRELNLTLTQGKEINTDDVTKRDFDLYITAAAEAISPLDYEILSIQHQSHKERVWALVNSVSDPLTQMATTKTSEEIFYLRRFLDAMFESYNTKRKEVMAVSSMQALETKIRKGARQSEGESSTQAVDKGLTGDQVEKLLAKLMHEKWISKSREGFYSLAPRALMELRSWLVDTYNDGDEPEEWQRIKFCVACKEIITIGQRCANGDCNIRLHNVCEDAYWRANPNRTCPRCKAGWDGKHYVGQKAATVTDDYLREKRKSGSNKRSRATQQEDEEDEEQERNGFRRRRNQVKEELEQNGGPSRRKGDLTPDPDPESASEQDTEPHEDVQMEDEDDDT
jgi:hypothetical protein